MIKEKLIEELQKLPDGVEVCICDWRKQLHHDVGCGSGAGIEARFEVQMLGVEDITEGSKPFAVLSFDNDDYDNSGILQV